MKSRQYQLTFYGWKSWISEHLRNEHCVVRTKNQNHVFPKRIFKTCSITNIMYMLCSYSSYYLWPPFFMSFFWLLPSNSFQVFGSHSIDSSPFMLAILKYLSYFSKKLFNQPSWLYLFTTFGTYTTRMWRPDMFVPALTSLTIRTISFVNITHTHTHTHTHFTNCKSLDRSAHFNLGFSDYNNLGDYNAHCFEILRK